MGRALFVLLASACRVAAQDLHFWTEDWDSALKRAKERNVPLVIAFIQDGEEANDRLWAALSTSKDFAKAANSIIPIIANHSVHEPKKATGTNPKNSSVCSKFGHVNCRQHIRLESMARAEFWPNGEVKTPAVIVFLPDLTETERLIDVHDPSAYVIAIDKARRRMGVGLDEEQWAKKTQQKAELEEALGKDEFGRALRAHEALRTLPQTPMLKEEIASYEDRIKAAKDRTLEELRKRFEAGEALAVLREAREVVVGVEKTAFARELSTLRRDWERRPEGRAAKELIDAEEKARPELEKAREAWQKKDTKLAVRQWFRVLDRVGQGPLHAEATEALAKVEADPALREQVKAELAEGRAGLLLSEARALAKTDRAKAKEIVQRIAAEYPGTKAAEAAQKLKLE